MSSSSIVRHSAFRSYRKQDALGAGSRQLTLAEAIASSAPPIPLNDSSSPESKQQSSITCNGKSEMKLTFLQWNAAQLSRLKLTELQMLAQEEDVDIISLCEVHRVDSPRKPNRIPGYEDCYYFTQPGTKGLAIYVRKSIIWNSREDLSSDINCFGKLAIAQAIEVTLDNQDSILIWNVYIHPESTKSLRQRFWKKLQSQCSAHSKFLILGDINEDNWMMNPHSDNSTPSFLPWVESESGIVVLNDGSMTRFRLMENGSHQSASLDATLASQDMVDIFCNWSVRHTLSSDHFPIITRFKTHYVSVPMKSIPQYINWKKAQRIVRNLWHSHEPAERSTKFLSILQTAIHQSGKPPNGSKKTACPWWDVELEQLRRRKNAARNRKQYDEFKKLKCEQRRLFRRKFKEYFIELARNISSSSNPWIILRILAPATKTRKRVHSSQTPIKRQLESERLATEYEDLYSENSPNEHPSPDLPPRSDVAPIRITRREIDAALAHSRKSSASGPDNLSYKDINHMWSEPRVGTCVLTTVNKWVDRGFPLEAKLSKICPIPKPGSVEGSYRPIALLNCLPKIVERILTSRLSLWIEPRLVSNQCGCRPQLSSTHCLMRLLHASSMAMNKKKFFGVLFLDFSKAYDRVIHNVLIQKLTDKFSVPPNLLHCIKDWLKDRRFFVEIGGCKSRVCRMPNGLPQGSSLSVLLWLAYINDIPVDEEVSAIFMDDTCIWAEADSLFELELKLQAASMSVQIWCRKNGIIINASKVKVLLNQYRSDFGITVAGSRIAASSEAKYLGFHLYSIPDSGHTLQFNLLHLARDLKRRANLLYPLRHKLPSSALRTFAEGLIMGKLQYYLPMLSTENQATLEPVAVAYRHCLRILVGGIKTTPLPLIHSQAGFPPLKLLIEDSCRKFYLNLMTNPNCLLAKEFENWTTDFYRGSPMMGLYRTEDMLPIDLTIYPLGGYSRPSRGILEQLYRCNFIINDDIEEAKEDLQVGNLIPDSDLYIYTDGSYRIADGKKPESAGAGFVVMDTSGGTLCEGSYRVKPSTSSYHSELMAMFAALDDFIEAHQTTVYGKTISILSDSRGLLTRLRSLSLNLSPAIDGVTEDILNYINLLFRAGVKNVSMVWIPGHIGIPGNEMADRLAFRGLDSRTIIESPLPPTTFRLWIRDLREYELKMYLESNVKPSSNPEAPNRALFGLPRMNPEPGKTKNRKAEVMFFRLLSGHTNTKDHWKRLGFKVEDTKCKLCSKEEETAAHLLLHCKIAWPRDNELKVLFQQSRKTFGQFVFSGDKRIRKTLIRSIEMLSRLGVVL